MKVDKYKCPNCGEELFWNSKFKVVLFTIFLGREYECRICGRKFSEAFLSTLKNKFKFRKYNVFK